MLHLMFPARNYLAPDLLPNVNFGAIVECESNSRCATNRILWGSEDGFAPIPFWEIFYGHNNAPERKGKMRI